MKFVFSNKFEKECFEDELDRIAHNSSKKTEFADTDVLLTTKIDFDSDFVDIDRSIKQLGDFDSSSLCSQCFKDQSCRDDRVF